LSFKEFIELGGSTLHKICQDRLLPGFCDELVVSRANKLKGKGLGISADLPQESVNRRRELMPKFKKTKEDGQSAFFKRSEPDKLYFTMLKNTQFFHEHVIADIFSRLTAKTELHVKFKN